MSIGNGRVLRFRHFLILLGPLVNYPIPARPDAFPSTLGHERSFLARLNGPLEVNEAGFRAHYRGMGVVWLN